VAGAPSRLRLPLRLVAGLQRGREERRERTVKREENGTKKGKGMGTTGKKKGEKGREKERTKGAGCPRHSFPPSSLQTITLHVSYDQNHRNAVVAGAPSRLR